MDQQHFEPMLALAIQQCARRLLHDIDLGCTMGCHISGRRWETRSSSYWPGMLTMRLLRALDGSIVAYRIVSASSSVAANSSPLQSMIRLLPTKWNLRSSPTRLTPA